MVFTAAAGLIPLSADNAEAVTKGSADAFVNEALKYEGKSLAQTKAAMKKSYGKISYLSGYKDDDQWCMWFVVNCAENVGVKGVIEQIKCERGRYKKNGTYRRAKAWGGNYEPERGNIVFFADKEGNKHIDWAAHVGIVRSCSNGKVYTIEGNSKGARARKKSYSLNDTYVLGYVDLDLNSCKSHKTDTKAGKCSNCGAEYIDYDKPSTDVATSYSAKRYYKIKSDTYLKKYPSSSAQNKSSSKLSAGKHICVIGTVSSGNWYKIRYSSTSKYVGYVPASAVQKYTPVKNDSTIKISDAKETYTVQKGNNPDINATVSSNYPIRNITVKVGDKTYSKTFSELYLSKGLNLKKNTGLNFSNFKAGANSYTFTATDISGKSTSVSGQVVIYDKGVKEPSITVKNTDTGKSVTIKNNESSGKIYYSQNGGSKKNSSNQSVTIKLSGAGTYKYDVYVWANSKRSCNVKKTVTLEQLSDPEINAEQTGKNGQVTIKSPDSGASVKYKVNDGSWQIYSGKTFKISDGDTVSAYAYRSGYVKSDVATFTGEFGEPSAPSVTISNEDGKAAAGKPATAVWKKDKRAESYTARLYRTEEEGDRLIEEKTTTECTESFTLPEAGNYYITVTASNEIGDSPASEKAAVTAVAPLTVRFTEAAEGTEAGKIIAELKVEYGSGIDKITAPSKKGYTFEGWTYSATGETSKNAYEKAVVKEDRTYTASFEKNTYEVKLYDTVGKLIETQHVAYEESADTSITPASDDDTAAANRKKAVEDSLEEGYVFMGWSVTGTSDGSSSADYTRVDSDMEVHAVAKWEKENLPVIVKIMSAEQSSDGRYVNAQIHLTTEKDKDLSMYLVAALKSTDSESGVQKTVYADRKIVYLDGADASAENSRSEKDIEMKLKIGNEAISTIEVMALQCHEDMSTGSAYSESVQSEVTISKRYGEASEWNETKPEAKEGRETEEKKQYRYRDTITAYSGYDSLTGYTKAGTETLSTTYGTWRSSSPSASVTTADAAKTETTVETQSAYKWYAYYCDCKKIAWKNSSGTCKYCGGKTKNTLIVYTASKTPYSKYDSSDKSYYFSKKLSSSAGGTVRSIYWKGSCTDSFSTNSTVKTSDGYAHIYLWKSSTFEKNIYRTKTVKTRNKFTKLSEYSAWQDTEPAAKSGRSIEERTVYSYRDEIKDTTGTVKLDTEKAYQSNPKFTVGITDDLSGKNASILVYQAANTDPNKYQLQYMGQTKLEKVLDESQNWTGQYTCDLKFIPKDEPNTETGNYIVSLAVEGAGLFKVDTIQAPKAEHTVTVNYRDADGRNVSVEKKVYDHEDLDMSDITAADTEGYYFGGWIGRTTDIRENGTVQANYVPIRNSVVLVNWINQDIDIYSVETGETLTLPDTAGETEGYEFNGWKLEDGTLTEPGSAESITVKGNMVITAQYTPLEYKVTFHGADGSTVETQSVKYGEAAEPPAYEAPEGSGTFAGWSTSEDWWSVTHDVEVYPIMVYDENALKPQARMYVEEKAADGTAAAVESEEALTADAPAAEETEVTDETEVKDTDIVKLELTTEEESGKIYYTTDGTVPTAELITVYQNTDKGDYQGSINEYEEPVSFDEDTQVIAVTYADGKCESEPELVYYTPQLNDVDASEKDGWQEIGNFAVKASPGKDVTVSADLSENPGLTECDFLVDCRSDVFYPDRDEYDDPICVKGPAFENGTTFVSENEQGIRITGVSETENTAAGNLFTLTMHVEDGAEEDVYPLDVYYMPENTRDGEFYETELTGLTMSVTSEASVDITTLEASLARASYTYEGKAIEPAVSIDGLKESEDYTVTYENNVDAGTAKAVITGIGGYVGTVEKEFTITQANIADAQAETIDARKYTGEAIEPVIKLSYGETELTADKDYTVTYSNNKDAGTASAVVTGTGNFKGTKTLEFDIVESDEAQIEKLQQMLADINAQIKALQDETSSLEKEADAAKKKQSDAEVAVKNAEEAKAAAEKELESASADKADAQVKLDAANTALENAEKELSDAKKEAAEAQKQLEEMTKEKEAAEKRASAAEKQLKELQSGKQEESSFIRYAGQSRYETSVAAADALKKSMGVDKFENIIVASGENYPDALAGSYLAMMENAPVIMVGRDTKTEASVRTYIRKNLEPDGTVYLLGGTGVVTSRFENNIKKLRIDDGSGVSVERLGGASRYDTNIAILKAAGIDANTGAEDLLVCTGEGFADSLSASAVGKPILLVAKAGLNSTQKQYLNSIEVNDVYLIGGTGVVSDSIARQLKSYDQDKACERVAGSNRYLTSVAVAETFFPDGADSAVLAYAQNFPDGLAGGPLALSMEAPLLLVDSSGYNAAVSYAKDAGIRKAAVLGGSALISDNVVKKIIQ